VNNIKVPSQSMWNARATWYAPGDRWSIAAWVKNLSDEVWIVDTLADPISTGRGVYVHGLPRTYGLSAQVNWGD
jgi:outer membrane receptor protein involved in Fe transport